MKVFITGGTTGIGHALAKKYLADGWDVGVCGRDLTRLEDKNLNENDKFKMYQVDVLNREELINAINDFSQGKLDLIIANAGRSVGSKTKMPNFEASRNVIEINVLGVLHTFEAAFEIMHKQQRGHLAAVASVAGFVGLPGAAPYSASKAAVLKLCEAYSLDLKQFGINVSVICPGFVETPLTKKNNHGMPFIMSATKAAKIIKKGLDAKRHIIIFPLAMRIVITTLAIMPRCLYRAIMGFKLFNYSKDK